MNIKLSDISNKTKIDFPEKLKYSNILKLSTPMKVEIISINEWLKYYGLEKYIFYFSEKCPHFIKSSNTFKNIKTNYELLYYFYTLGFFFESINSIVNDYYYRYLFIEKPRKDYLPKEEILNYIKSDLYKFVTAYKYLSEQEIDYKKLNSIIGHNPTNQEYKYILENTKILRFLESKTYISQNIFKNEIKEKLKLFDFDDLVNIEHHCYLNSILSVEIELLKNFNLITKTKDLNVKNGCDASMNKTQFKEFIEKNKSLEYLLSCDNILKIDNIKNVIIQKYNAKTFLEEKRVNLFNNVVKPLKRLPNNVSKKIYEFIFPNDEQIFSLKRFNFLNQIPKTKLFKKKKLRVFFINGHGTSCYLENYKRTERLDIKGITNDFNKKTIKLPLDEMKNRPFFYYNNLSIINSQPLGRLSLLNYLEVFNELLSSTIFRKNILNSLLSAYKREHFNLIEKLFNIYIFKKIFKNSRDTDKDFEDLIQKFESNSKKTRIAKYHYGQTKHTNENYLNFTKYNNLNPPPNVTYSFNKYNEKEPLLGIYEIDMHNEKTINQLINILNIKKSNKYDVKLGLNTKELFDYKGDIPKDYDEIFKYNKKLYDSKKLIFTLEDIMNIILENGKIKEDEHVIIFSNHCRGLVSTKKPTNNIQKHYNTYFNFDEDNRKKINKLRKDSLNRMKKTLKPNNLPYSPPTPPKKTRRKRGQKRKGAKRTVYNTN